jgi:hypothetical protein
MAVSLASNKVMWRKISGKVLISDFLHRHFLNYVICLTLGTCTRFSDIFDVEFSEICDFRKGIERLIHAGQIS